MNTMCRIVLLSVFVLSGCGKVDRATEIGAMIDRHIANLLNTDGPGREADDSLTTGLKEIELLSNDVVQVRYMTEWIDKLLAARIESDDYHLWSRRINSIPPHIESILTKIRCSNADVDQVFDLRVRLLRWYQEELKALKPTREIDPHDGNYGEERIWWQDCYEKTFVSYRSFVNRLEAWWYPDETKELSEEHRTQIRNKIEACLARKMRTRKEVRADRNWETDEYKAVRSRAVAR